MLQSIAKMTHPVRNGTVPLTVLCSGATGAGTGMLVTNGMIYLPASFIFKKKNFKIRLIMPE